MMTGLLVGTLIAAGLIGAGAAVDNTARNSYAAKEAQQNLKSIVKDSDTLKNLDLDKLIDQAYILNKITAEDKAKYLNLLKDFDDTYNFGSVWSGKTKDEIVRLYGVLSDIAPEIETVLNNYAGIDVKNALVSSMPDIAGAPGYTAFDVNFKSPVADLEAEPLKWWGGKELAEHHDLQWDLDTMYNAVKEGTAQQVVADTYASNALNNASLRGDHLNEVSYLSSLRDSKSDAITSGATAGARAANEILGIVNSTNDYSESQADVANNRWTTVQQALLNDANAAVTANNAYANLGKNIFDNIEYLYANDVDRRGAELTAYADLYAADQALRGSYEQANASMAAEQAQANANIANARNSMYDASNKYSWLWDRLYGANIEQGYNEQEARALANAQFFTNAMTEQLATNANVPSGYRDYLNKYDQ